MMTLPNRIAGLLAAAAVMAALLWASNAPMTAHGSNAAVLRLAWSARPERIEDCRQRSAEELAKLPQHMRQPLACEGTTAEYRLRVRIDGSLVTDRIVHGGGLRRDRRLYVFEEVALPPGEREIDIRFDRVESGRPEHPADAADDRGLEHHDAAPLGGRGEFVPPSLSFERRVRAVSREVLLVTYSSERRALVTVQNPTAGTQ
jgi:hypothetical protein